MSYRVIAPLVLAKDREGKTQHCYQDAVIQWLTDEQAEHFLESGLVVEILAAAALPDPDSDKESAGDDDVKPPKVATKAVLVDWLLDHGTYGRDELEDQTKDELWDLIDATD